MKRHLNIAYKKLKTIEYNVKSFAHLYQIIHTFVTFITLTLGLLLHIFSFKTSIEKKKKIYLKKRTKDAQYA